MKDKALLLQKKEKEKLKKQKEARLEEKFRLDKKHERYS